MLEIAPAGLWKTSDSIRRERDSSRWCRVPELLKRRHVSARHQRSGAVSRDGLSALAATARRIHIPAAPWPGTAQKMRKAPAFPATNRTSAPCPAGNVPSLEELWDS